MEVRDEALLWSEFGAPKGMCVGNHEKAPVRDKADSEENAIPVARIAANVVQLDVSLKRTLAVRTYGPILLICERTAEIDHGLGMDASGLDWMLMCCLSL